MSDQRRFGDVISLEEVFRSREFGRRPKRRGSVPVATVEPPDPLHLEQVFHSEFFGRPEALGPIPVFGSIAGPEGGVRVPNLVLLPGRGEAEREFARYRGAIGAVSGVAAAALVVAGMTSGTGSPSGRPVVSAEGTHPGQRSPAGATPPGPGGVGTSPPALGAAGSPPATQGSAGGTQIAQFTSTTTPPPGVVVVQSFPPPPGFGPPPPPPPPPGGGTAPSGPSPGSGGVLKPLLVTVGHTVSTVGTTVTATSAGLAQAAPAASPVTGLLSSVGGTVTSLGRSVASA